MTRATTSAIGHCGRLALRPLVAFTGMIKVLVLALASIRRQRRAAHRVAFLETLRHIRGVGVSTLRPVLAIGFLVGVIGALQLVSLLAPFLGAARVWTTLISMVVQEFAPIWTAVVVASRSATIVSSELVHMNASSELDALRTMGVNPMHFAVLPRIAAVVVSTVSLSAACVAAALLGCGVVACGWHGQSLALFMDYLQAAVAPFDVVLFAGKSALFGVVIATIAVWYGLGAEAVTDRFAQAAGRATLPAVAACVAVDFVAAVLRYVRVSDSHAWFP